MLWLYARQPGRVLKKLNVIRKRDCSEILENDSDCWAFSFLRPLSTAGHIARGKKITWIPAFPLGKWNGHSNLNTETFLLFILVTTCYHKLKPKPIRVPSRHSCQRHSYTRLSSFWISVRVLFKCQGFLTSRKQTLPRGVASFLTSSRPGWISFSHTLKIAHMTSMHWPHQHFEIWSFLVHPNNA